MSATIEGDLFDRYFRLPLRLRSLPRVRVDGSAFPVATRYLENALALTGHKVRAAAEWCVHSDASRRRMSEAQIPLAPMASRAEMRARYPHASDGVLDALRQLDLSVVNVDLVTQLLRCFVRAGSAAEAKEPQATGDAAADCDGFGDASDRLPSGGSVLVFLPGTAEIDATQRAIVGLLATHDGRVRREWVLPLHGTLPPTEQARVFDEPPPGVTKIVLSTNVAEVSRLPHRFCSDPSRLTCTPLVNMGELVLWRARPRA